ncbi:MAG: carboxypeptidase regulatory-like domain-containing protein, partial [Planctomycetota bacterium]|nr:carboxypeptidase regulatory-like domain-containing protein [Planctomycetota bacterium]
AQETILEVMVDQESVEAVPESGPAELLGASADRDQEQLRESAPTASPVESAKSDTNGPRCTVIGHVVDSNNAPLPDVSVQLAGYKGWAEGLDLPRLEGRYDFRGWETITDANGYFRFETPLPTVERTKLAITPGPFHDSESMWFGEGNSRSKPPLLEGERDLGTITLETTGAITGTVVDVHGAPLAQVKMSIGPTPNTTYSRDAWTDENGFYSLGHAPIGTYGVSTKLEGYLNQFQEPVEVVGGQKREGVNFVLEASPTIEGFVVNESGQPISGARIIGWPTGGAGGSAASTRSRKDGSFTMSLPQVQPVSMAAKLDGYETWGEEHGRGTVFEPGTRGLQIVMPTLPPTRFLVLDDETGQPLVRFGLNILEDNGSKSTGSLHTERRRPRSKDHAEGIAEATAREGVDLYVIAADGFLKATGDVEHDQPGSGLQTVRLRKGTGLSGRVLYEGNPVPGAKVQIERGVLLSDQHMSSLSSQGIQLLNIPKGWRPDRSSRKTILTDASGAFLFEGLEPGTYRVDANASGKGNVPQTTVELARDSRNLGDLILAPSGTIVGSVQLPVHVEPEGLSVYLNGARNGRKALVNAAGGFTFTEVAAGTHTLHLAGRPGELAATNQVEVQVASADSVNVTLDARDRAMCEVTLLIDLGGLDVEGMIVSLEATEEGVQERFQLGPCDKDGRARGHVRAWGKASVEVWSMDMPSLTHPDVRLDLVPGGTIDRVVAYELTSLSITLPPRVGFPERGNALVKLKYADSTISEQHRRLWFREGSLKDGASKAARINGHTLTLEGLVAGSLQFEVNLMESIPHDEMPESNLETVSFGGQMIDGKLLMNQPPYLSHAQTIVLKSGEEFVIRLP